MTTKSKFLDPKLSAFIEHKSFGNYKTIGSLIRDMLCRVLYWENFKGQKVPANTPDAHPVGFSYNAILAAVKKAFPKSNTRYKNLRWYACQMRQEGIMFPVWRGRSKWIGIDNSERQDALKHAIKVKKAQSLWAEEMERRKREG